MCKILVADDHPLFREAIGLALADFPSDDENQIIEAASVQDVIRIAADHHDLDLLLLDIYMPGMDGLAGLVEIRRRYPALPVVMVTASEDPSMVQQTLACGVAGYIPKTYGREQIAAALNEVMRGEIYRPPHLDPTIIDERVQHRVKVAERLRSLTPQQLKVLKAVIEGKPNKIIAYELDIAEKTVKAHITAVLRKLGVFSRTQAVLATHELLTEFEGPPG